MKPATVEYLIAAKTRWTFRFEFFGFYTLYLLIFQALLQ